MGSGPSRENCALGCPQGSCLVGKGWKGAWVGREFFFRNLFFFFMSELRGQNGPDVFGAKNAFVHDLSRAIAALGRPPGLPSLTGRWKRTGRLGAIFDRKQLFFLYGPISRSNRAPTFLKPFLRLFPPERARSLRLGVPSSFPPDLAYKACGTILLIFFPKQTFLGLYGRHVGHPGWRLSRRDPQVSLVGNVFSIYF